LLQLKTSHLTCHTSTKRVILSQSDAPRLTVRDFKITRQYFEVRSVYNLIPMSWVCSTWLRQP